MGRLRSIEGVELSVQRTIELPRSCVRPAAGLDDGGRSLAELAAGRPENSARDSTCRASSQNLSSPCVTKMTDAQGAR
jgi:hypothetical protein